MHGVRPTIGATRYEKDNVKFFDLVVSNDPTNKKLWKDLGAKRAVGLPYTAINPKAHKKLMLTRVEKSKYGSKVVFVGTLLPKRQKTLKYLVKNRLPIKIWGHIPPGDKLDKVLEKQYLGEAWGDEETKIYNASLMAVNLVDESMPIGGNLRTFRIPGCGAMQLAQRCSDKWFRKDKEVVLFDNDKQLAEKIEHLLKSPKKIKQIANAGYKRAHKEHIYEKRFEKIMSLVFKNA
jgi:spore maturation protein CgeB